jgi:2-keto-4-pentenoate hydratase/2-oxohepta-3-ene-1,7-dioic acid hydratase in catechol pathway
VTDLSKTKQARVIEGSIFGNYKITNKIVDIKRLLTPLALEDVRTVRCLGLNYEKHAKESNLPIPEYPVLFYKPVTSLTGPLDPIPVHAQAQVGEGLDYEVELVVVIGRPCSDVSESEALDYVLGYAVGNDVSHRDWQLKYGGQWGIGKGFDGWGPFGPGIVSNKAIGNPQALRISTKVNGKTVQDGSTDDMIFGIAKSIAFLSKGTTLLPGDVIFTGT